MQIFLAAGAAYFELTFSDKFYFWTLKGFFVG